MLLRSKTKAIFPIITFGLLNKYCKTGQKNFTDKEIKNYYEESVNYFKQHLGHSLHIGGTYYDAYPSRNLPKYGVLEVKRNKKYLLRNEFQRAASKLIKLIPDLVKEHITAKIGIIPLLDSVTERNKAAENMEEFLNLLSREMSINPANFEVFSFAILKIHLEKFACRLYRDTRTAAHDKGVDLSTNFGVVYQIKKLKLFNRNVANLIYQELQTNFSEDRIKDGNVVLVIDDISKEVKSFLINMKVQSLSKEDILNLASLLEVEDRLKVLRVVFDEFSREYKSNI